MTLVHISIQAFPQDNRKHFLYFQKAFLLVLEAAYRSSAFPVYTECAMGKLQWGTFVPGSGLSYQHPFPAPCLDFYKHKLGDETGKPLTEDQICRLRRNPGSLALFPFPSISVGRSPENAQLLHTNDWIQPVEMERSTSAGRRTAKACPEVLQLLLNFILHL